jgi:hypothetical protein
MQHHDFHPSELDRGTRFRETLRSSAHLSTEHLDRAQELLQGALEKHNMPELTVHNFDKVLETMQRDPGYRHLYSSGPVFENALREHLGLGAKPDA